MTAPHRDPELPAIAADAFQGLAGDIVRAIAPTTEADPAALLVTLCSAMGALIGDGPHVQLGGSRHPARIWPLVIGATSSGRKGESWAQIERFIELVDPSFLRDRLTSGLSSGEGLIAAFQDRTSDESPSPVDKRLLVVESEFARPLQAASRQGNTLPTVLRSFWDSGHAAVLTRTEPLKATGAHLVVIAHVTPRELRMKLNDADISGGLVNRFLPVLVKRSQRLARPIEPVSLRTLAGTVTQRLGAARRLSLVRLDGASADLWESAYDALCDDEDDNGPLAEVLARGPAYCHRLALIYALLDGASAVQPVHLTAALALWRYVAATARHVFGDLSGRSDIDLLSAYLADAPRGRTKTDIHGLFARNKSGAQIDALLSELDGRGLIDVQHEKTDGPGRAPTRAYWIGEPVDRLGELLQSNERNEVDSQEISA